MKENQYKLNIARNIKDYRLKAGLSQQALGDLINCKQQVIQNYECTRHNVMAYRLMTIAKALNVNVQDMYK